MTLNVTKRDPLRDARLLKRFAQGGVFSSVVVVQALFFLFLNFSLTQTLVGFFVGELLAVFAIEVTFHQIFKLRRQGSYPTIIAIALGDAHDLQDACEISLAMAGRYLGATHSFLAWADNPRQLVPMCDVCMPDNWTHLAEADAVWLDAVRHAIDGRAPVIRRADTGAFPQNLRDAHSWALVPLNVRGRISAVLFLAGPRGAQDLRDSKMLEAVGMVIGMALENMRLRSQEYESIMSVLCSALDMRDSATEGHSQRVARMAGLLAERLGLARSEVKLIERAAALHDIGKIGVADAILSKPGPLTDDEWQKMRQHPRLGYEMVCAIDTLRRAADIIHSHHERYDGSGYPRGLGGDQIPLGARIFAVVDTYDAMTSHRPYRPARPHAEAIREISRNSGMQFDPAVVQAFLVLDSEGLITPHDSAEEETPSPQIADRRAAGARLKANA